MKNGRPAKNAGAPWDEIRTAYITGTATMGEVAKRYNLAAGTVQHKAAKEKWADARDEWRKEQAQKACDAAATRLQDETSARLADSLVNVAFIADRLEAAVISTLADPEQLNRYLVQKSRRKHDGTTEMDYYTTTSDKVDTRALKDLTAATRGIYEIKKELQGLVTVQEERRHRIETERLELERERLELEKERQALARERAEKEDQSGGAVHVVVGGYQDDWSR